MTREEVQKRYEEVNHVFDALEVGMKVHITSDGNEWYDARYWGFLDGKSLFFFTSQGRLTVLNTPFILTQLPEEDEQDSDANPS
jgi:hypothetical protein